MCDSYWIGLHSHQIEDCFPTHDILSSQSLLGLPCRNLPINHKPTPKCTSPDNPLFYPTNIYWMPMIWQPIRVRGNHTDFLGLNLCIWSLAVFYTWMTQKQLGWASPSSPTLKLKTSQWCYSTFVPPAQHDTHHFPHLIVNHKQCLQSAHLTPPFSLIHNPSSLTSTSITFLTVAHQFWSHSCRGFFIVQKKETFKAQTLQHSLQALSTDQ